MENIVDFHRERVQYDADLLLVAKTLITDMHIGEPTELQAAFLDYAEKVLGYKITLVMAQNISDYYDFEKRQKR